ncbi:hypothetical protein Mapa_018343 [Marchantia paleacea]|nr:hypothetical protein Mapa_018343 [Marchantia paleacea]
MLFPLIILTIPTVFIGFIGILFDENKMNVDSLSYWLTLSINSFNYSNSEKFLEFLFNAIPSVSIAFFGILIAFYLYGPNFSFLKKEKKKLQLKSEIDIVLKSFSNFIYN